MKQNKFSTSSDMLMRNATFAEPRHLLIADTNIQDETILLDHLTPNTELWRVDNNSNVAHLLSAALSGSYKTIHFLAHGLPGGIVLGNKIVGIKEFTTAVSEQAKALSLHFWSCNTALGAKGKAFVDALSQTCGAAVTAFSGLVGAANKGGSWQPDVVVGNGGVATIVPFAYASAYPHTMAASALKITSEKNADGNIDVKVWLAAGTYINSATLVFHYNESDAALVLVNGQPVTKSGVSGWSWLSSQTDTGVMELGTYGSVTTVGSATEDLLLNSLRFTAPVSGSFTVSLNGSYLENADTGMVDLGTLPDFVFDDNDNLNDLPTGSVLITGTVMQGETLTATNTLADADGIASGAIHYEWLANSDVIGSGDTLVLSEAEVGKTITVIASYTDGHSTAESVTSAATGVVIDDDNGSNETDLSGHITFWKSGEAITDVTTTLTALPTDGTHAIELKNIHVNADGSHTVDVWATTPNSTTGSFECEFLLPDGSSATWQDAQGLPKDWSSHANPTASGSFLVLGMSGTSLVTLSEGSVKLGTLTISQPTTPDHFDLLLATGMVGDDTVEGFGVVSNSANTGNDNYYHYINLADSSYALTADKIAGAREASAVHVNDAYAALKMAVELNPNDDGSAVLPYQYLAADINRDGKVRANDAFNILKMALDAPSAPSDEWIFVAESVASKTMSRSHVDWSDINPVIDVDQTSIELDLIGIVKGDVDGSWGVVGG